jgi:hypothetical protein
MGVGWQALCIYKGKKVSEREKNATAAFSDQFILRQKKQIPPWRKIMKKIITSLMALVFAVGISAAVQAQGIVEKPQSPVTKVESTTTKAKKGVDKTKKGLAGKEICNPGAKTCGGESPKDDKAK